MATPDTYRQRPYRPPGAQATSTAERERGNVSGWHERRAERKRARLVNRRTRRALAQSLRRTARDAKDRNRAPRRPYVAHAGRRWCWSPLRHHRAAAVRTHLREVAALVEQVWCWSPLLHYRAAAVRTDLLEVAALLEQAHDPDPACVAAFRELLTNGDSPLYHPHTPFSDLKATLDYVRSGL